MQILYQGDETAILEVAPEYTPRETEAMQRAVLNIFDRWGVRDGDAAVILGGLSAKTLGRWRQGHFGRVNRDLADRMSYVLGIHKALRIVFADPKMGYRWMSQPNETFYGQPPLSMLMRGGLDDLRRMRRYLEFGPGGLVTLEEQAVPISRVCWPKTHRLVMSHYPPINLYDDVADPHDWEALAAAQARTNPRIYEEIGDLSLVPPERRPSGDGASWIMTAFTHISPDRRTRFSDGTFGIYYAGDSLETALYEHTYHMGRFYARSNTPPGWVSEVRQLIGTVDADLTDLRRDGFADLLDPDDYGASQLFGTVQKQSGANGIVYPSVRHPGGECIAILFPDVVTPPLQADHFRYYWNGHHVSYAHQVTSEKRTLELRPA